MQKLLFTCYHAAFSPPQRSGNSSQFRGGNFSHTNCHYYDIGWHPQFYLSRRSTSPVISPICKTLKTDSDQGLLWFVLTAHTIRPRRFPGLPSVDLLKPVTARAATASPPRLPIVHVLSGHLPWFWVLPAGLPSVNLLCPQILLEEVSAPKGSQRAPPEPRGLGQEICISRGERRRR